MGKHANAAVRKESLDMAASMIVNVFKPHSVIL